MKITIAVAVWFLLFHGLALPCEGPPIPPSSAYSIDTNIQDDKPPGAVEIADWRVERDPDEEKYNDSCEQVRCMPEASIGFQVVPEQDQDVLGYIVRSVGENTCSCDTCSEPIQSSGGWIWISKTYSAGKDIHCVFGVSAVDPAGNEGSESRIEVFDPGDEGGCTSRPGGTFSVLGLLAIALICIRWRK